jgi:hypothetical protein
MLWLSQKEEKISAQNLHWDKHYYGEAKDILICKGNIYMAKKFRKVGIEITHKNDDESVGIVMVNSDLINRILTSAKNDELDGTDPLENAVVAVFDGILKHAVYIKPTGKGKERSQLVKIKE